LCGFANRLVDDGGKIMGNEGFGVKFVAKKAESIKADSMMQIYESFQEQQVIKDPTQVYGYSNPPALIGIINPYVLADLFSEKIKISNQKFSGQKPFVMKMTKDDTINAINKYTAAAEMSPVTEKDLFSPDSVLFQPLVSSQVVRQCVEMEMVMNPAAMSHTAVRPVMAVPIISRGASTGASGALTPEDHGNATNVGEAVKPTGEPCPVRDKISNDRRDFIGDIKQGACLDCWFMAAFYSWVWCKKIPPTLTPTNGIYTINFYLYNYNTTVWTPVPIYLKPFLPLNSSSKLVFAQITPDRSEIWPALYEKAYSEFNNLASLTIPGATKGSSPGPYDPDTGQFQKGDPLIALMHISRYLASEGPGNNINRPTVYLTQNLKNNPYLGTTAFDVLRLCNDTSSTTPYPTVAWTYDSDSGPAPYAFPKSGWPLNPILAPGHSYSVLGRYVDTTGKNNIVLRNPWDLPIAKASAPAVFANSLATGVWKPDSVIASLNLKLEDNSYGIFALENSAFEKYFKGFGWAQFSSVYKPV
jgi:hypothetical protein